MTPPLPDGEGVSRLPVAQYLFAHFRFDLRSHQLFRGDEAVLLSGKAWDTLLVLVANRHRVVSKDELLDLVWPGKAVSDDLLPQNILALRRALGDDPGQPKFIATTPRRGYRFIAPVTVVPVGDPAHDPISSFYDRAAIESEARPRESLSIPSARPRWLQPILWFSIVTATALAVFAVTRIRTSLPTVVNNRPLRFTHVAPEGTVSVSDAVLSPNGHYLAFVAEDELTGQTALWLKALDAAEGRALEGTGDAAKPFWSPDSQSLGFFAGGKLKRTDLAGNPPLTIADVGLSPAGGTWSARGIILFARWKSGLTAVTDTGGNVKPVTTLDPMAQETAHVAPQFLPDGRHFLYFVSSANAEKAGMYVGVLDDQSKQRVANVAATYVAPGYLVMIRDGAMMAQRFDVSRLEANGAPSVLAGNLPNGTFVSGSDGNLLTFGSTPGGSRLVWFNRAGDALGTIDAPVHLHNPALSPDLKQLIASSGDADQRGVWLIDVERGVSTKIMPYGTSPWLSPDSQRFVFTSDRVGGVADVYARSIAGQNDEELVLRTGENKIVNDWSLDGRYIVFVSTNPVTKKDIWLLPQFGTRKPIPYLQTSSNEIQGQISPDGRWMAYASDESGTWQVYVQTFPVPGRKRVISVSGGAQPRWRRDGKELFYLAPNHTLMAVDVSLGDAIELGRPHALFHANLFGRLNTYRSHYTVTADGQRFLVDATEGQRPVTTIVNWTALVKP